MQRYQTEDEHRKAMRAKINKAIKRGRRRKRIIRRLKKAVPGICIGVFIAGMGAWCIAAPLPDPDDYEPYRFQAENGQWYTQEEYEQMSRERDAYHQREREEAEKEAQMIRDYQEQYQKDQEAEWKLYQEQTRTGLIHSMDFDARTQTTQRQQQISYRQPRRRPTRLSRIYSTPWQQQDRSAAQSDGQCPIWPQLLISSAMPESVVLKEPRH